MDKYDELLARLDKMWMLLGNRRDFEAAAAIRELEADAERYRHMRASAQFQDRNGPGLYWYLPRWNRELSLGERLDTAIDAAMKGDSNG